MFFCQECTIPYFFNLFIEAKKNLLSFPALLILRLGPSTPSPPPPASPHTPTLLLHASSLYIRFTHKPSVFTQILQTLFFQNKSLIFFDQYTHTQTSRVGCRLSGDLSGNRALCTILSALRPIRSHSLKHSLHSSLCFVPCIQTVVLLYCCTALQVVKIAKQFLITLLFNL